jgi:hypothetical protein
MRSVPLHRILPSTGRGDISGYAAANGAMILKLRFSFPLSVAHVENYGRGRPAETDEIKLELALLATSISLGLPTISYN